MKDTTWWGILWILIALTGHNIASCVTESKRDKQFDEVLRHLRELNPKKVEKDESPRVNR